jgi:hypothetical protein
LPFGGSGFRFDFLVFHLDLLRGFLVLSEGGADVAKMSHCREFFQGEEISYVVKAPRSSGAADVAKMSHYRKITIYAKNSLV